VRYGLPELVSAQLIDTTFDVDVVADVYAHVSPQKNRVLSVDHRAKQTAASQP